MMQANRYFCKYWARTVWTARSTRWSGSGVSRSGGAPPCPRGGDGRRRPLAPGTGRGHGAGKLGGLGGAISSHRRRGLADGEQRVACRPIRTKPVSTAHCVPRVSQRDVITICRGPINRVNYLSGSRDPFK